jgi:hypothetical protein
VFAGIRYSEDLLTASTKDTIKLATNLVATMSALVLGLMVNSAKDSYDAVRGEVIEMSAKIAFLDRVLVGYGAESSEARARLRESIEQMLNRMWPQNGTRSVDLTPATQFGNAVYIAIQNLAPKDDVQRSLKTEATTLALDLGKTRTMLLVRSIPTISKLVMVVLISWLVIIFFSFSMLAPTNKPAILALIVSALSVCGAIFLILELDRPFGGWVGVPSAPIVQALAQLGK